MQASHERVEGPSQPSSDEQDSNAKAECQMNGHGSRSVRLQECQQAGIVRSLRCQVDCAKHVSVFSVKQKVAELTARHDILLLHSLFAEPDCLPITSAYLKTDECNHVLGTVPVLLPQQLIHKGDIHFVL